MSSKATGPGDLTLGPQPFPGPAALATWGLLRGFSPCLAALSIHSSFISKLLGNGKQDLGFAHKCRYSAAATGCLLVREKGLWDAFERKRGEPMSVLSNQDSDPKSEQKRDFRPHRRLELL